MNRGSELARVQFRCSRRSSLDKECKVNDDLGSQGAQSKMKIDSNWNSFVEQSY